MMDLSNVAVNGCCLLDVNGHDYVMTRQMFIWRKPSFWVRVWFILCQASGSDNMSHLTVQQMACLEMESHVSPPHSSSQDG